MISVAFYMAYVIFIGNIYGKIFVKIFFVFCQYGAKIIVGFLSGGNIFYPVLYKTVF